MRSVSIWTVACAAALTVACGDNAIVNPWIVIAGTTGMVGITNGAVA